MNRATQISHDSRRVVRVLIADSDGAIRSLYGESLRLAGCDVVDAVDGRDALIKALSQRPTVVIAETTLPFFDGYALCGVLKRDSMTSTVPILVVTSEKRPAELDRARDAGADVVLIKPISPDALLHEIQQVLRRPTKPTDEKQAAQPDRRRKP